ncbi:hypothetical protein BS50DRAFT_636297 [Corynespora cassiicola Philippines]|uniref:Uncharacterized protein n=1 Tax=Corynespora cassiicola Philippines TaxID=1448308 RepID=A0A2T2NJC0_CORCC|nr:hypothetical protein BS50DRAFT_636297 [Corynespora cassiicola Philippines]
MPDNTAAPTPTATARSTSNRRLPVIEKQSPPNRINVENGTILTVSPAFGKIPPAHDSRPGDNLIDPNSWRHVNQLVKELMSLPPQAFPSSRNRDGLVRVMLSWCVKTVGESHFYHDGKMGRMRLRPESKIRTHGLIAGLPQGYYRWLVGDERQEPDTRAEIETLFAIPEQVWRQHRYQLDYKPRYY